MLHMRKLVGVVLSVSLFFAGSTYVTNAKIKNAQAQEKTANFPVAQLMPTKWEALDMLRRGMLEKGTIIDATYTEEELNGFIEGALASKNVSWFFDHATVKINEGSIDVSGTMLKPIKGQFMVHASVFLQDKKLVISVLSARYGIFKVPTSFVEKVGNFILKKNSMDEWLHVSGARFEEFTLSKGLVHIRVIGE